MPLKRARVSGGAPTGDQDDQAAAGSALITMGQEPSQPRTLPSDAAPKGRRRPENREKDAGNMHNTFARLLGRARGKDGTGIDNARAIKVVRKDIAERLNALMGSDAAVEALGDELLTKLERIRSGLEKVEEVQELKHQRRVDYPEGYLDLVHEVITAHQTALIDAAALAGMKNVLTSNQLRDSELKQLKINNEQLQEENDSLKKHLASTGALCLNMALRPLGYECKEDDLKNDISVIRAALLAKVNELTKVSAGACTSSLEDIAKYRAVLEAKQAALEAKQAALGVLSGIDVD